MGSQHTLIKGMGRWTVAVLTDNWADNWTSIFFLESGFEVNQAWWHVPVVPSLGRQKAETSGTQASFQQGHRSAPCLVTRRCSQYQGQNRTDSIRGNDGKQMNHQTNKVFCRYKLKNPRLSSRRFDGSLLGARICVRRGRHVSTKAKPSPK